MLGAPRQATRSNILTERSSEQQQNTPKSMPIRKETSLQKTSSASTADVTDADLDDSNLRRSSRARKPVQSNPSPVQSTRKTRTPGSKTAHSSSATKGTSSSSTTSSRSQDRVEGEEESEGEGVEEEEGSEAESLDGEHSDFETAPRKRVRTNSGGIPAQNKSRPVANRWATNTKPASAKRKGKGPAVAMDFDEDIRDANEETPKPRGRNASRKTVVENADDMNIYDIVLNPNSALEQAASDWMDTYTTDNTEGILQLVNFIIQSSGCSGFVPREHFEEEEVVDIISGLQEQLENESIQDYPLISKAKPFKKFRRNFLELINRVINRARHTCLTDGVFLDTLQIWVTSMSSSAFRPFRHTATTAGLAIVTALCEICHSTAQDLSVAERQLASEQKRAKSTQPVRVHTLTGKVEGLQRDRDMIEEHIKQLYDGVFILRYRDVDPMIRSECIRELGVWIMTYPEHFLGDHSLKYIGWLLSDKSEIARMETVKALARLVDRKESSTMGASSSALRRFFERFHGRIVDMALRESDHSVRMAALSLCSSAGKHGHLLEADAEDLCPLLFHADAKVRRGIAPFVAREIEQTVNDQIAEAEGSLSNNEEIDEESITLKILANCLARYGSKSRAEAMLKANETLETDGDNENGEDTWDDEESVTAEIGGRTAKAVEALWGMIPILQNWQSLAKYLTQDHTSVAGLSSQKGKRSAAQTEDALQMNQLSDSEETTLVEVFVATIRNLTSPTAVAGITPREKKKAESSCEETRSAISRYLVNALPQLLAKYAPEPLRLCEILQLPRLMDLEVYTELRMGRSFETLTADIVNVFMKHSRRQVLDAAVECLRTLSLSKDHQDAVEDNLNELADELVNGLAEYDKRENLAVAILDEDERHELCGSVTRLERFTAIMNPLRGFEENANGEIALSVLEKVGERGKLGEAADAPLVLSAFRTLYKLVLWRSYAIKTHSGDDPESLKSTVDRFVRLRDKVIDLAEQLALGATHAPLVVKKCAFNSLVDIHLLSSGAWIDEIGAEAAEKVEMTVPEGRQERYATYVGTVIEQYAEKFLEGNDERNEDSDGEDNDDEDEPASGRGGRKGKRKGKASSQVKKADPNNQRVDIRMLHHLKQAGAAIVKLVRFSLFHLRHVSVILAWHKRLDPAYDELGKKLIDVLGEVWRSSAEEESLSEVMDACLESLKESFEHHLDQGTATADATVALAKQIAQALRPPHREALTSAQSGALARLHVRGISHVVAKTAGYHRIDARTAKARSLKFFRALCPFVTFLGSENARYVQRKVNDILEENGLNVADQKDWEPYHSYLKLLEKNIGKAPPTGSRQRKTGTASGTAASTQNRVDLENANGEEGSRRRRPNISPLARKGRKTLVRTEEEEEDEVPLKDRRAERALIRQQAQTVRDSRLDKNGVAGDVRQMAGPSKQGGDDTKKSDADEVQEEEEEEEEEEAVEGEGEDEGEEIEDEEQNTGDEDRDRSPNRESDATDDGEATPRPKSRHVTASKRKESESTLDLVDPVPPVAPSGARKRAPSKDTEESSEEEKDSLPDRRKRLRR